MKKIIVAIVAFLYLSTSVGATVHMHYCMGKLINWKLWHDNSNKCSNCGMEKKSGKKNACCRDEHKQVKLSNDQKAAESSFQLIQLLPVALPPAFFQLPVYRLSSVTEENPISHAPPRSSSLAVHIRNCVFLI